MSSPFILLCCAHTHSIIYVMHVWKEGGGGGKRVQPTLNTFQDWYENKGLSFSPESALLLKTIQFTQLNWLFIILRSFQATLKCITHRTKHDWASN